jgi:hypothetical protein
LFFEPVASEPDIKNDVPGSHDTRASKFMEDVMTVILVLLFFVAFLLADYLMKPAPAQTYVMRGTTITSPGFEMLGALAQDGGTLKSEDAETDEVLAKLRRTSAVGATKK